MADTLDSIDGVLAAIKFHKPSQYDPAGRPYLIARLSNGTTVKGMMRTPKEGQSYRFWGTWKDDGKGFGDAFAFDAYEPIIDKSSSGVAAYLAMHVDGVGPAKAERIVEHFGDDTLEVLRKTPERLIEVGGLRDAIIEAIKDHFSEHLAFDPAAYAALVELFDGYKVGKRTIERILKAFGSDALEIVRENPYRLLALPRMGWATVDAIATGRLEYDPAGIERHAAAILEALELLAMEGHTVSPRPDVEAKASSLVGMPLNESAVMYLRGEEEVIPGADAYGPTLALASLMDAEKSLADCLETLAESAGPLPFTLATPELGDDQRRAAELVQEHGVAIIAGPPGTGKSFTVARIVSRLIDEGITSIKVVAPTGKAAKRSEELLRGAGIESVNATTIHRALGFGGSATDEEEGIPGNEAKHGRGRSGYVFLHNEDDPIECKVLIVDETSMVDARLGSALLRAIAPGTRVIFVGDQHQLPSVGPGSVLRDMIEGGIPTAYLEQIRRSDGGGSVVQACHAIIKGGIPQPADRVELPTKNWIHIEESSPAEIARLVVDLHTKDSATFGKVWDRQVITPQKRRLPVACDNLNKLLGDALNPGAPVGSDEDGPLPPFRIGDKVIRTKNGKVMEMRKVERAEGNRAKGEVDFWWNGAGYQLAEGYAVNGDMGTVEGIAEGTKGRVAIVRFRDPERLARISMEKHHLIQAYAVTVHKSQGSGFPYVICPVHSCFYWNTRTNTGIASRELIYTAISRAERLLVTVGEWSALAAMIGRKTVHQRVTTLAARIAESVNREAVEVPF